MSDVEARADRVRAIAECVGGKVLDRNGDAVRIEIPADTATLRRIDHERSQCLSLA
jgi:hypothetical protein